MLDKKQDGGARTSLQTLLYFIGLTARMQPSMLLLAGLYAIFRAGVPFVGVLLPKLVIDELSGAADAGRLLTYVLLAAGISALLYLVSEGLRLLLDKGGVRLDAKFDEMLVKKNCEMDFQHLEDPETLTILQQARQGRITRGGIMAVMSWHLPALLSNLLTCAGMLWVVSSLDWWMLLLLLVCVGLNLLLLRKSSDANNAFMMLMGDLNRSFNYLIPLAYDFSNGKDIRLYDAAPMIVGRQRQFAVEAEKAEKENYRVLSLCEVWQALLTQGQSGVIYLALLVQLFQRGLGIGDFVMYTAAAVSFSTALISVFNEAVEGLISARMTAPYRKFMALPDKSSRGSEAVLQESGEIVFENVSFTYPRATEPTLKHLNLTLKRNQRLAVVGENGAGKTTMIKLLLRLYEPSEGRILFNGRDIRELSIEAYMRMFSVVFQDFKLFAFSVKENLCLGEEERERLDRVLAQTGLDQVLKEHEAGADTSVYKSFDKNGVEFSGGERQKMAIARALYRNSPIVVMDEPTAALDPIAEAEIYGQLNALIEGKTALFISHRLSSCKFCDEVAVFENGSVVQLGSHDELVQKDGLYRRMFTAQAQYYA